MSERCGAGALEYERKDNKSVRVLTVLVYVLCVSLAAIMLSLYYVFFWEPKDAHHALRKVHTVTRTTLPTCLPHTGRGDTTVRSSENSENSTESTPKAFNYTSTQSTPDTSASTIADASALMSTPDTSAPTLIPATSAQTSTADVSAPTLTPDASARTPANLTVDT